MVSLGAVPDGTDPKGFPIVIDPPVAGRYRWVAGDALKVALAQPLKNAHEYRVTVPRGTRGLSGPGLTQDFSWTFETPRPRLVTMAPWPRKVLRADRLLPSDSLALTFNQNVAPAEVRRAARLTAGSEERSFAVKQLLGDPRRVLVTPDQPLPMATRVTFQVPPGLRSLEGPLGSEEAKKVSYATPDPLSVRGACGPSKLEDSPECLPMVDQRMGAPLNLMFSEPVYRDDLLKALTIQPAPAKLRDELHPVWNLCREDDRRGPCSRQYRFDGALAPRRAHRLVIRAGLADIFGQRLTQPYAADFKTRSYPPGLFLAPDHRIHREPGQDYVIKAINLKKVEVTLHAFTGAALVRFAECAKKHSDWFARCTGGCAPTRQVLSLRSTRDRVGSVRVRLPRGLVAMRVSSPEVVDHEGKRVELDRLALQSDVGLHARVTPFGLTAWVTSLGTGQPLKDTEVLVFDAAGKQLHTAKTNAAGLLEVPPKPFGGLLGGKEAPQLYVVARKGADEAYVALPGEGPYWGGEDEAYLLSPSDLGQAYGWQGDRPRLVGTVSTERGIYRPGQTVHIQGAMRVYRTWKPTPAAGREATVSLLHANDVLTEKTIEASPFGAFHLRLPLPKTGNLGRHVVQVEVDGETVATHSFKVAEYRAPRFRVLAAPMPYDVLAKDPLTIRTTAVYLFGGAMAGAGYRMSLASSYHGTWLGNHQVGCSGLPERQRRPWLLREGALGADGKTKEVIDLQKGPLDKPCPVAHHAEVEVWSADRQTVATSAWARQWPGELIVGLKDLPAKNKTLRWRLFVHRWNSATVTSGQVTATLYEVRRGSVDWSRKLFQKKVTVGPRGVELAVPWPDDIESHPGLLVLAVPDPGGQVAWTTTTVHEPSAWAHDYARQASEEQRRQEQLLLRLDKDEYLPGDVATVTVTRKGSAGSGLLFVERERTFHTIPLRFDGAGRATVQIPVTEAFAGSVTVRAVLTRQGKHLRARDGPLAATTTRLRVSDAPYTLSAMVKTNRKVYRPGDTVMVGVTVQDGLGHPRRAQVVLMAVDESVLRLTPYHLPNPRRDLFHTPADQVRADDVRRHLASLRIPIEHVDHAAPLGLSGIGEGGGGRGEGIGLGSIGTIGHGSGSGLGTGTGTGGKKRRPRKLFLTTAWHTSVVTDAKGSAVASFELPDNLTEYRIMAFVVDAKRSAGTGRANFRVDLPVAALPALPRLARVGDRFEAGVVLYNSVRPAGPARVTAKVAGKTIALRGASHRQVILGKDEEREVKFSFEATRAGTSKLAFEVTMGSLTDSIVHPLTVHSPVLLEAAAVSGQTQGAVRQRLAPLGALRPDRGGLEVRLSSTALTGVEDGLEQLIGYPYGCLEQKGSKLLGLIAAVVLSDRFGIDASRETRAPILPALQEILALQQNDGGFGFWPESRDSSVWGTAYALMVLHRAHRSKAATGAVVPRQAIERAVAFLTPHAGKSSWGSYSFSYRAAVIYALALSGEKVETHALWLFNHRRRQPLFARAMLLSALKTQRQVGRVHEAVTELSRELSDSLRVEGTWAHAEENLHDGYQVLMHSDDRTTAMVLMALTAAQQQHPMVPRLVRWFLQGRKQAGYRNTQEAAWALMALWDYAERWEKQVPDFEAGVWLGQRRIVSALFRGRQVKPSEAKLTMAELQRAGGARAKDLVIGKKGKGTLYYVARLRYARRQLPQKPRDHGFTVHRSVEVLDGAGRVLAKQRPPGLGDTLLVTVTVSAPEARRYVVIDDPLPAGVEALDTSLATAAQSFGATATRTGSDRYDHRELRDDRVLFFRDLMQPGKLTYRYLARVTTAGRFVAPPTKAEAMYNPEIFGHNAAAWVRYVSRSPGGSGGPPTPAKP
ncbi:MAG: hypothetical protein JRI68_22900, partial [Deltaproteobacteria bacterium]|nr:hypothetical protein [Deltaproteobacteria bacterium]